MLPTSHPSEWSEREGSKRQESLMTCSMVALFISSHGHNCKAMPSPCQRSEVTLKPSAKCHHTGSHGSKGGTGCVCSLSSFPGFILCRKQRITRKRLGYKVTLSGMGLMPRWQVRWEKHLLLNLKPVWFQGPSWWKERADSVLWCPCVL